MNAREQFRSIMSYQPADGVPLMEIEGYEEAAVVRWRAEGLPEGVWPAKALGMKSPEALPVDFFPVPPYEQEVLQEDDNYRLVRNSFGIVVKQPKGRTEYAYEGYVEHPVKDRATWLEYRKRLDATSPERFANWDAEHWDYYNKADHPIGLVVHPYFFRLGLYAMGLESFLLAFYDQPDLLHEMFAHRTEMTLKIIEEVLAHVKIDYCCIAEDFAYRTGPHISVDMYREFWQPHQPPVIEALQKGDVQSIVMWSSGDLRAILPTLIDMGFNTTWPCEEFVGMDAVELTKEYGRDMRFVGNIGIRTVAAGPKAIDEAIDRKVRPLLARGGYIPTLDDQASPDISWENYCYYIDRLREL